MTDISKNFLKQIKSITCPACTVCPNHTHRQCHSVSNSASSNVKHVKSHHHHVSDSESEAEDSMTPLLQVLLQKKSTGKTDSDSEISGSEAKYTSPCPHIDEEQILKIKTVQQFVDITYGRIFSQFVEKDKVFSQVIDPENDDDDGLTVPVGMPLWDVKLKELYVKALVTLKDGHHSPHLEPFCFSDCFLPALQKPKFCDVIAKLNSKHEKLHYMSDWLKSSEEIAQEISSGSELGNEIKMLLFKVYRLQKGINDICTIEIKDWKENQFQTFLDIHILSHLNNDIVHDSNSVSCPCGCDVNVKLGRTSIGIPSKTFYGHLDAIVGGGADVEFADNNIKRKEIRRRDFAEVMNVEVSNKSGMHFFSHLDDNLVPTLDVSKLSILEIKQLIKNLKKALSQSFCELVTLGYTDRNSSARKRKKQGDQSIRRNFLVKNILIDNGVFAVLFYEVETDTMLMSNFFPLNSPNSMVQLAILLNFQLFFKGCNLRCFESFEMVNILNNMGMLQYFNMLSFYTQKIFYPWKGFYANKRPAIDSICGPSKRLKPNSKNKHDDEVKEEKRNVIANQSSDTILRVLINNLEAVKNEIKHYEEIRIPELDEQKTNLRETRKKLKNFSTTNEFDIQLFDEKMENFVIEWRAELKEQIQKEKETETDPKTDEKSNYRIRKKNIRRLRKMLKSFSETKEFDSELYNKKMNDFVNERRNEIKQQIRDINTELENVNSKIKKQEKKGDRIWRKLITK